jgi:hypothetical protein
MMDEEHRHRCEARQLLAWRVQFGKQWLRDHLCAVESSRGAAARKRLEADISTQWALRNRGAHQDWRESVVA